MRLRRCITALLLSALAMPAGVSAAPGVVRVPVTFSVSNANRSRLPCSADGLPYRVRGELVARDDVLRTSGTPVTVFLHEFSFGRFYWSFQAVPGYDLAGELARRGHVAVVLDRLGYDISDRPAGTSTCLGAQADMAAQVVRALRAGTYQAQGRAAPRFGEVVLAGHSVGGGIAELAAHSFPDLDLAGIALLGWADQGYSPRALQQTLRQSQACAGGGDPGARRGYAWFGRSAADFRRNVFHSADAAVVAATLRLRNPDPCGDNQSLGRLAAVNSAGVGSLTIPVLLQWGERDAVFLPDADDAQLRLYRSARSTTHRRYAGAGHALLLERNAGAVRGDFERWLRVVAPPQR